jgi:hypothetical protein
VLVAVCLSCLPFLEFESTEISTDSQASKFHRSLTFQNWVSFATMDDPYFSDSSFSVVSLCPGCSCGVCKWTEHKEFLEELSKALKADDTTNNQKRFSMYRNYTLAEWGVLGVMNRKKIPKCVTEKIVEMFPSVTGEYVGFVANKGGEKDSSDDCQEYSIDNQESDSDSSFSSHCLDEDEGND